MTPASRGNWYIAAAWLVVLGGYVCLSLWIPAGSSRAAGANLLLCLMPLGVNGALLVNAVTPEWRKRSFWMLLAVGCSLWLVGQAIWGYIESYQNARVPILYGGQFAFFLHAVPMIAALSMQPHKPSDERGVLYGYVDFGLMFCWWLYLYAYFVLPWQFVVVDETKFLQAVRFVSLLENGVFVGGALALAARTTGYWRRVYREIAAAGGLYLLGIVLIDLFVDRSHYSRAGLYNLPLLASFLWLGTAALRAHRYRAEEPNTTAQAPPEAPASLNPANETIWTPRIVRTALLSLPLMGFLTLVVSQAPLATREFRALVTFAAALPFGFLAFLRHELTDRERLRLLRVSQESIDNLKRLQTQFVQSEKLASIGQLVAGAAHEINNPLTAILGYSDLLAEDPASTDKTKSLADKIREQARRTKTIVNNLLSFARQAPNELRASVDINAVVNTSAQFRRFDLRGKNIRIDVQAGSGIPEVRGDMNQLLQVFSNIINNAVYAMAETGSGGTLTIRTQLEKGNVVILFSDTGPGMRDPNLVFDPFYTTKPVGKGTGLGLSICYGLIRDQGGQISCYNRPEGGATFRIEFPAAPPAFPFSPRSVVAPARSTPAKTA